MPGSFGAVEAPARERHGTGVAFYVAPRSWPVSRWDEKGPTAGAFAMGREGLGRTLQIGTFQRVEVAPGQHRMTRMARMTHGPPTWRYLAGVAPAE